MYIKTGRSRGVASKVNLDETIRLFTEEGKTLQEIGDIFGVTRERIRQILKLQGLTKINGGKHIKTFLNTDVRLKKIKDKEAMQEAKCQKMWGCTREQFKFFGSQAVKGTITNKFKTQRNNAKKRGIAWELTLKEWWDIWQESGHWNERGLGAGKYVMARECDTGAYSKDNVKIVTHSENSIEAREMDYIRGRWKESNISILAKKHNIRVGTLNRRINAGWDLQRALTEPLHKSKWNNYAMV